MVPLRTSSPGPVLLFFLVLLSAWSLVTGVVLAYRAETIFGATAATLFVVVSFVLAMPVAVKLTRKRWLDRLPPARRVQLDGEEAEFHPRRTGWPTLVGYLVPGVLGLWSSAMAVVGAVEENWAWPVLFAVPAIYFLGFPVLALVGRLRPGGVWVTSTRIVDEHFGLRSELAMRDVAVLVPWSAELVVMPHEGTPVRHQHLTPRPWRARQVRDRLVINTEHLAGGTTGLAADVQGLLDVRRR